MTKRKKKNKQKFKQNGIEKLLVGLNEVVSTRGVNAEAAQSLIDWYLRRQSWTMKQYDFASSLCKRRRAAPKQSNMVKKYHLYAIGDDGAIKLGVSTDVRGRRRALQTGSDRNLKVLWKFYVGRCRQSAYAAEKKLHKHCSRHRKRGEWFEPECMVLVEQFTMKDKLEREKEQEEYDLKLLETSQI